MSFDPKTATLEEAKAWLRARFFDGAVCPCCAQNVKLYKRSLHGGMAASLIAFAKVTQATSPKDGWLKVPDDFVQTTKLVTVLGNREYNKLRYWGLLEGQAPEQNLESDTPYSGLWRITELGFRFVRGEVKLPKNVFVYNKNQLKPPVGTVVEDIDIKQALGTKFNYDELMGSAAS